jgi:hypothetical protein
VSEVETLWQQFLEVPRGPGRRHFLEGVVLGKSPDAAWELLDQFQARADAATINSKSGGTMSTSASEIQRLQSQIDALKRQGAPPIGDKRDFISAQTRAESVYQAFGDSAPPPLAGETAHSYRQRLVQGVQQHSPQYRNVNLAGCNPSILNGFEDAIYNDAQAHASDSSRFRPGQMHPIVINDGAGRPITKYIGHQGACWDQFCPPTRFAREGLASFKTPGTPR